MEWDENGIPKGYGKLGGSKKASLKNKFFDQDYDKFIKSKKLTQKQKERVAKAGLVGIIIAICTVLYLPQLFSPNLAGWMFEVFGQHKFLTSEFMIWQPFTAMWLHGGFIHLAVNMIVLWSFGKVMQKMWDNKKLLFLYVASGIGGGILMMIMSTIYPFTFGVGASGAICGLLGAMAILNPDSKVLLFFFIPAKIGSTVKWFAIISFGLMITNSFGIPLLSNIGHSAHLGGLVVGYLITRYWKEKGSLYSTFI